MNEDPMTYTKQLQSDLDGMQLKLQAAWETIDTLTKERDAAVELLKDISEIFPACNGWYMDDNKQCDERLDAFLRQMEKNDE